MRFVPHFYSNYPSLQERNLKNFFNTWQQYFYCTLISNRQNHKINVCGTQIMRDHPTALQPLLSPREGWHVGLLNNKLCWVREGNTPAAGCCHNMRACRIAGKVLRENAPAVHSCSRRLATSGCNHKERRMQRSDPTLLIFVFTHCSIFRFLGGKMGALSV